ncbi:MULTISPECIES: hypothetical protein [unclassified Halomonas]|uniref:hypothetical protein n=1 Tax=unclassified Halomonas TaxID=2609666 RepID=UPI00209DA3FF|nr:MULTISPECIES: hypothetical protein [unclassified Halomonas]MCP1315165.1 hypothetical protein [Halomonas sp. 707D7]MCP1326144.1 hypothetical protein [Halomonas sp. 707D4]
MPLFVFISTTFPTAIFSILLVAAVIYWLISLSGIGGDDLGDGDMGDGFETGGLMATLGLEGVPLPLAITLVALFGWLFSYFSELLLGVHLGSGALHWLFGAVVLCLSVAVGVLLASLAVKPLRPLFKPALHLPTEQRLAGLVCTVRSGSVDRTRGRADAYIEGDHLILQVRSDQPLKRGDRAILINYLAEEDAYRVIPEEEFHAGFNDSPTR